MKVRGSASPFVLSFSGLAMSFLALLLSRISVLSSCYRCKYIDHLPYLTGSWARWLHSRRRLLHSKACLGTQRSNCRFLQPDHQLSSTKTSCIITGVLHQSTPEWFNGEGCLRGCSLSLSSLTYLHVRNGGPLIRCSVPGCRPPIRVTGLEGTRESLRRRVEKW
jgi:hypothetical protein